MAEQKHPDAGISEHREFIDELEQLSSPDPGGFYNAPESVTDIDEIDDVGAILQDSSSNDDYLPSSRNHWLKPGLADAGLIRDATCFAFWP